MAQCVLKGNPDLYGIGVRVGLYTQWIAQLLTTIFKPRDEAELRVVNLIVQWSIFLGICKESTNGGSPVGSVLTQVLLCGSLSSLTAISVRHRGTLSGVFRFVFYTALAAYGIWFWFVGIDKMHIDNCDTKDQIVFFGGVSITGGFRTFGKVFAVLGLIASTALLVYNLLAIRYQPQDKARSAQQARPRIELGFLALSLMLIALSIGLVEYLVDVNNIQDLSGIDSVGQFLPLLVGTISCFQALSSIISSKMKINRCWYLFNHHLFKPKR